MGLVRVGVRYEGRVQGVGFRATAHQLAVGRPVSGWVRNLRDGGVEVEAQGDEAEVAAFLHSIRLALGGKIHSAAESPLVVDPDEPGDGFAIRL